MEYQGRRNFLEKCDFLIPRFDWRFHKETGGCVLPIGHSGYHLTQLRNGNFLSWGGWACGEDCEFCGECFNWSEVSEAEAQVIIADPSKNNDD